MRDCDSLGYLTPKQGMLSIRENSQHGSAVRLCLDFYKPDLYNAIHWQYSKGTAHCISSCRVSRELGSVGKKRSDLKINFKWAFLGRSFLLFYFNFFLPWQWNAVTQTVGPTELRPVSHCWPSHLTPPLHQLWCFCDSRLNCCCVKSAEIEANKKGNRFMPPGSHEKMVEDRLRKKTGCCGRAGSVRLAIASTTALLVPCSSKWGYTFINIYFNKNTILCNTVSLPSCSMYNCLPSHHLGKEGQEVFVFVIAFNQSVLQSSLSSGHTNRCAGKSEGLHRTGNKQLEEGGC